MKLISRSALVLLFGGALFIACQTPTHAEDSVKFKLAEKLIAEDARIYYRTVSQDGKHIAWLADAMDLPCACGECPRPPATAKRVYLDGKALAEYDNVWYPTFSPDGKTLAYIASRDGEMFAVANEREGKRYSEIDLGSLSVSPEGDAWFVVREGDKLRAACGNSLGEPFDEIDYLYTDGRPGSFSFAPDGRVVYAARRDDDLNMDIVIGGETYGPFYHVGFFLLNIPNYLVFSADGKRFVFTAEGDSDEFVVLDGKRVTPDGESFGGTISPDGKRFAYIKGRRDSGCKDIVIDGETTVVGVRDGVLSIAGKEFYGTIQPGSSVVFSPDSKHVAYWVETIDPKGCMVFIDGETRFYRRASGIRKIAWAPDSDGVAVFYAYPDIVEVNGEVEPLSKELCGYRYFTFSPDGKRYGYAGVSIGESDTLVVDGSASNPVKNIRYQPVFSPDSKHVVCAGYNGNSRDDNILLVIDGEIAAAHGSIYAPLDTPADYDCCGRITWATADRFHYFAEDDGNLYFVEITILDGDD